MCVFANGLDVGVVASGVKFLLRVALFSANLFVHRLSFPLFHCLYHHLVGTVCSTALVPFPLGSYMWR